MLLLVHATWWHTWQFSFGFLLTRVNNRGHYFDAGLDYDMWMDKGLQDDSFAVSITSFAAVNWLFE
jgi:hypothetical protein